MIFNLALFFEEKLEKEIVEYAKEIKGELKTRPHITLFKYEGEKPSEEIKKLIGKKVNIKFEGLNLLPSRDYGTWVEIKVLKNENLLELQKEISNLIKEKPINELRDKFRAHVTLFNSKEGEVNFSNLDKDLLRREVIGNLDYYSY